MLYKNHGGKNWWAMFRDPRRPGKFIRKSTGTPVLKDARSVEQAMHLSIKGQITEQRMKDVLSAIFAKDAAAAGLPLAQLWQLYEKFITRRDRKPGARLLKQRRKNLDDFIKWSNKDYPVASAEEVSFDCATAYADYLKRKCKLKDKSRKEYIGNLSTIWNAASAFHDLKNPWRNVQPVVRDGTRHAAFTREEEAAVLAAAKVSAVPHWYEACLIARWTGLRKHDVVYLEWRSVDFDKGVIKTKPIKTQGYDITVEVPMVDVLRNALQRLYRKKRKYVLPEFARVYPGDPEDCTFASILKAAGVKDPTITFHSWRHTFRTRLAEAGVSSDLAKRLGGWTQDATVQRYDHADKTDEIRQALESTAATKV
ncbi:MAG: tyrosine-type recombinase/integrase [Kiritimatiellae bacterium]|nr:tyrosine-type recombinase/integrase [Kiritimatiellia bacterium]